MDDSGWVFQFGQPLAAAPLAPRTHGITPSPLPAGSLLGLRAPHLGREHHTASHCMAFQYPPCAPKGRRITGEGEICAWLSLSLLSPPHLASNSAPRSICLLTEPAADLCFRAESFELIIPGWLCCSLLFLRWTHALVPSQFRVCPDSQSPVCMKSSWNARLGNAPAGQEFTVLAARVCMNFERWTREGRVTRPVGILSTFKVSQPPSRLAILHVSACSHRVDESHHTNACPLSEWVGG
ncbi:hypothetical protein MAPG_08255 [Magnaporthiopsis poae ATCC 64411]|uniref:Uncharacterized protein n=1 Tax=Magnaporthiopsis poae (strain ATCC 64411 / 73-15) TaxID=644358 RepID=A0A0C4E6V8_MAGP6|nr:hypothetical protein MAPG_08255 [Magnaporthiopsis poae ATCC 64411]